MLYIVIFNHSSHGRYVSLIFIYLTHKELNFKIISQLSVFFHFRQMLKLYLHNNSKKWREHVK